MRGNFVPLLLLWRRFRSGGVRPRLFLTGLVLRRLEGEVLFYRVLAFKLSHLFVQGNQLINKWLHGPSDGVFDLKIKPSRGHAGFYFETRPTAVLEEAAEVEGFFSFASARSCSSFSFCKYFLARSLYSPVSSEVSPTTENLKVKLT